MKKLVLLFMLAIATSLLWAAAPSINNWSVKIDSVTVDSQFTDDAWELLDTIIIIKDDTCNTLYTITGLAVLDPYDKLYVGFGDGYAGDSASVDTFIFEPDKRNRHTIKMPFIATYLDSLRHQTDANDTIYFRVAVGGASQGEKIMLENVILSAEVMDYSVGGMIGE